MPLILEGIVTTLNEDDSINVAPMGPLVDRAITHLTLRPFQTSQTFRNLRRSRQGVLHVTDNVELLARAAVNQLSLPPHRPARTVHGVILDDACRWYEFQVRELDDRAERTRLECDVVDRGVAREFFGFNRAKHAVVEAAILATRLGLLSREDVLAELSRLKTLVDKTAGDQEQRAFSFVEDYVRAWKPETPV